MDKKEFDIVSPNNYQNMFKHGGYGAKLFDPRWREKRQIILKRDNNKCSNCASTEFLEIHHKQYHFSKMQNGFKQPWEYDDKYLITLCKKCHRKGHDKFKIPTFYTK